MFVLRWIGLGIIALLLAFSCGLVFSAPFNDFFANNVTQPFRIFTGTEAAQALQRELGITLPASTADHHFAYQGGRRYWIRMQISSSDLNGLFRGSSFLTCNFPLQDNFRPVFEHGRILNSEQLLLTNWWTPETARVYIGGECTGTDFKIFRMFSDTGNPQAWVFYLEVIQL